MFAAANIGGVGYYRSDDEGATWIQINDLSLGFGSVSANVMAADPRVYGRYVVEGKMRGYLLIIFCLECTLVPTVGAYSMAMFPLRVVHPRALLWAHHRLQLFQLRLPRLLVL